MTHPTIPNKYLAITCDVEALPLEAETDHVDRLIWGNFPGTTHPLGIGAMMDIADEFGVKITFFLDAMERIKYGSRIDDVAHLIMDRGHDLQLHIHIEFIPDEFWAKLGYRKVTWAMNLFDDQTAQIVVDYAVDLFEKMTGTKPLAYRAGAFRYNSAILRAIQKQGIKLSYQYYPVTTLKPSYAHGFDAGILPVFQWSNGVYEIPMGCIENPIPRKTRYTGFAYIWPPEKALDYTLKFFAQGPEHKVLVMLLHSWSLLHKDPTGGLYEWKDKTLASHFEHYLASLPRGVQIVSAPELLEKIEQKEIVPKFEMPLCVAGTEHLPLFLSPAPAAVAVNPA